MGSGPVVALLLLAAWGYAGVFSVTIFMDVLVRTAGIQIDGLFIAVFTLAVQSPDVAV